jgi:hypothetical protein
MHVWESLALAWYRSSELNEEQLRRSLGYRTRLRSKASCQGINERADCVRGLR